MARSDPGEQGLAGRVGHLGRVIATNLLLIAVLASLPELLATVLLNHPGPLSGDALEVFRQHYARHDRKIIQFLPECAVYDPLLTYRLEPPGCRIENREHEVEYRVNRLGARDDEASLEAPEVIVLGDSHAMGWGVAQDETFAEILERERGTEVLNLGISSFGTVRELLFLAEADTSRLRTLILQYCDNDEKENRTFQDAGGALPVSSRRVYESSVEDHLASSTYSPFHHTLSLTRIWRHLETPKRPPDTPEQVIAERDLREARTFLNALTGSTTDLRDVTLLVVELNAYGRNDAHFTDALRRAVAELPPERPWKRLEIVDLSSVLSREHYFRLDDHMNASGHRRVAEVLLPLVGPSP